MDITRNGKIGAVVQLGLGSFRDVGFQLFGLLTEVVENEMHTSSPSKAFDKTVNWQNCFLKMPMIQV